MDQRVFEDSKATHRNDGGDTTESDCEDDVQCKQELKCEAQMTAAAVGAVADAPKSSQGSPPPVEAAWITPPAMTLPPGISPNSILAVAFIPSVFPPAVVTPIESEVTVSPPISMAVDLPTITPSLGESCTLCGQTFPPHESPRVEEQENACTGVSMVCVCCQRPSLTDRDFSTNQRSKGPTRQRCFTCVRGGNVPLETICRLFPGGRVKPSKAQMAIEKAARKKHQAIAKRRATISRNKLEKQRLEEQQRQDRLANGGPDEVVLTQEADASDDPYDEKMDHMEKAVRNLLMANRSLYRRHQVNDLDGPDREAYQLELLQEEATLHDQAVALCRTNAAMYDRVCEKVLVVDGKVKLGERDHEQGDFDGDKPNHHVTKNGTIRIVRKKPDNRLLELNKALLRTAQATARSSPPSMDEPSPKRVKRVDANGIEMAVLNRPRRTVAKPATYVLYDSDVE